MIFRETRLAGAFVIEPEKLEDDRGFFARSWCEREFAEHKLNPRIAQCNISRNKKKGTLRGMHYQVAPHTEAKLVRCTQGAIFDVIIDLRAGSPTFKQHLAETLTAQNHKMLYVPEGMAHGFQSLEDNSEVFYQISEFYAPQYARGVRWNDPAFGISWPITDPIMLERDRNYPDFTS
ncbi:MAG TPA: dTDP-4-dehydrorhamnose 3,5-epimerase [Terriglobales bacterium]|nr:dTDP-4-dehydrorhamnose 3,5-epimerase [Terriglobales bacterium]